jgi:polyisoprenyl-phosphate glycosyltransferase
VNGVDVFTDMDDRVHDVAVVVPVYRGEDCLAPLVAELGVLRAEQRSPAGARWRVSEIILVHDCGPDRSDVVIRSLALQEPLVRPIWLSRNFGQHAATLAGMASSAATWVVTMDEDGQHDPTAIGAMLDTALATSSALVYGTPADGAPHAWWRNVTSRLGKRLVDVLSGVPAATFSSFRLIVGEQARAVAAYCGQGIYLDVALSWVVQRSATQIVTARSERRATSGYTLRGLARHWASLVLSSATRLLRLVALTGVVFAVLGIGGALYILASLAVRGPVIPGWASVIVTILVTNGLMLFFFGIIAEYVSSLFRLGLGRPLYVMVSDPADGPLGGSLRRPVGAAATGSPDGAIAGEAAGQVGGSPGGPVAGEAAGQVGGSPGGPIAGQISRQVGGMLDDDRAGEAGTR